MSKDRQKQGKGKELRGFVNNDECTCKRHTEDMCGDMTGYKSQPVRIMIFKDDCPVHGKPQEKRGGHQPPTPGKGVSIWVPETMKKTMSQFEANPVPHSNMRGIDPRYYLDRGYIAYKGVWYLSWELSWWTRYLLRKLRKRGVQAVFLDSNIFKDSHDSKS